MNWTHLKRIAWKDYRRMSSLWFAIVGFWILLLSITTGYALFYRGSTFLADKEVMMLMIPFMAVIHGLAWAAVTFSAEHEDNTYNFLRSLPVDSKHVFFGKFAYGVTSTLGLILALGAACFTARAVLESQNIRVDAARVGGFTEVCVFLFSLVPVALAVGVFWSLRVKQPLLCLVFTALTLLATPIVNILTMVTETYNGGVSTAASPFAITISSLLMGLIAAAIYLVDRRLVASWFPNVSPTSHAAHLSAASQSQSSPFRGAFLRLLWLQAKDRLVLLPLLVAIICLSIWLLGSDPGFSDFAQNVGRYFSIFVLTGFLGVLVFRPEHSRERYRFLAQLGVSPSEYWWSRILLPLGIVLPLGLLAVAARQEQAYVFIGLVGMFAIGQLASMACTSTIVACAVTLFCSTVAWFWLALCAITHIPVWLGGAPLVIMPLAASYLRTPRWFQNTRSWKQWIVPMIPIALLAFAVPAACGLFRTYEVPTAVLPAEFETADMSILETDGTQAYRETFSILPNDPPTSFDFDENVRDPFFAEWMISSSDFIPKLMSAIEKGGPVPEEFRHGSQESNYTAFEKYYMSAVCLLLSADQALENGDSETTWKQLAGALQLARHNNDGRSTTTAAMMSFNIESNVYDRLVPWAMANETSVESVQKAAEFIEQSRQSQPPWKNCAIADYRLLNNLWNDPLLISEYGDDARWVSAAMKLPWERARSKRLLKHYFTRVYEKVTRDETQLQPIPTALAETTLLGAQASLDDWLFDHTRHVEHARRGAIYQLALIGYRLKHGDYPADLRSIRVGGESLPEDVFAPGSLLVVEELPDASPAMGPHLRSSAGTSTRSDGTQEALHFLLPMLDEWNVMRFRERKFKTSSEWKPSIRTRGAEDAMNILADTNTRIDAYANVLRQIESTQTDWHMRNRLQEKLRSGEARERFGIVDGLMEAAPILTDMEMGGQERGNDATSDLTILTQLMSTLIEILDSSDDVPVNAAIARLLEKAIENDSGDFVSRFELEHHLSRSEPRDERFGMNRIPIRNPVNGYYYERTTDEGGGLLLNEAAELARSRIFRAVQGKLVAADTDPEFLKQAFSDLGDHWHADSDPGDGESREVIIEFVLP